MLLALIACTCAGPAAEPPAPEPPPTPQLQSVHEPLCATPLACGLLAHYAYDTVQASVCGWCGEANPAVCGTWLPAAPDADLPRCSIYRELERCVLQHSGTTRFADLPAMAQTNILALQDRADQQTDCVVMDPPNPDAN